MPTVEIEYCVPCGFRDRALDLEGALLASLEARLDRVCLVTGEHGVFRVRVDGDLVYDKDEHDLDVDGVVREVRAAL